MIEVAVEEAAEGANPLGWPGGEVGEGAVLDFAILAETFAEEDGRRGVAIGDDGDIHANSILHAHNTTIAIMIHYMTTSVGAKAT